VNSGPGDQLLAPPWHRIELMEPKPRTAYCETCELPMADDQALKQHLDGAAREATLRYLDLDDTPPRALTDDIGRDDKKLEENWQNARRLARIVDAMTVDQLRIMALESLANSADPRFLLRQCLGRHGDDNWDEPTPG